MTKAMEVWELVRELEGLKMPNASVVVEVSLGEEYHPERPSAGVIGVRTKLNAVVLEGVEGL